MSLPSLHPATGRQASEDCPPDLSEAIPQQVWTAKPDGAFDFVNSRVLDYFGRTFEQMIGWGWRDYIHPEDVSEALELWMHSVATGDFFEAEFRMLRARDASYRLHLAQASPMRDGHGSIIRWAGTYTDVSRRKTACKAPAILALEGERSRWEFLAEAGAILGSSLDYEVTLRNVAQLTVPAIADWCTIEFVQQDGLIKTFAIAHSNPSKVEMAHEYRRRYPIDPARPVGVPQVIRTGKGELHPSVDLEQLKAAALDAEHLELLVSLGLKSVMILPLSAAGRTFGAITFISAESGRTFSEDDFKLAGSLADRAALSVENARLFRETQERHEALLKETADRREAENTIRTQGNQLRQIGDNLPDGLLYQIMADPDGSRKFVYFSAGLERITGVPIEEALRDAVSLYSLIHPEDGPKIAKAEERCLREHCNYDVVVRLKHRITEEWRWVHMRSAPRLLLDGRIVWDGIYLDVTEARRTEEALERSMERLELAQKTGRIGVFDWLVRTGEVVRNEEECRLFGLEPGNTSLEASRKRVYPEDLQRTHEEMAAAIERRETELAFSYRVVRPCGQIRWVESAARFFYDEESKLERMVGVNIDVTEKREAQLTLEQSESSLRTVVESASASGIGILRSHIEGQIMEANDAFLKMVGYTREDLVCGRLNWLHMTPPEFLELDARQTAQMSATGQCHSFEKHYFRKDGSRVPILLSGNFVPGTNGEYICFILDLSEQKEAQSALRAAKETAEAASNAKDHFLATLSHELRTPLAPVVPLLAELAAQVELPESVREDLRTIQRNIALETRLIDDLLDLTRVVRGKLQLRKETLNFRTLLEETVAICCTQEVVSNKVSTRLLYETGQVYLGADPVRLQQVFWNLLSNAYKFSLPEGTVVIRVSDSSEDKLSIEVTDGGAGFSMEMLPRLFEPFEQETGPSARERRGLGLGLAITKSLIEAHGGSISGESQGVNQGATFRVLLPAAHRELGTATPPRPREARSGNLPARILLVEDHDDTGRIMERLLKKRGYRVRLATSKAEALQFGGEEQFDILVSDIGLPDGSGLEVMAELRKSSPIPGIALSGFGMDTDIQKSKEAGFIEHLVKPVNFTQLLQVLEEACGQAVRLPPS